MERQEFDPIALVTVYLTGKLWAVSSFGGDHSGRQIALSGKVVPMKGYHGVSPEDLKAASVKVTVRHLGTGEASKTAAKANDYFKNPLAFLREAGGFTKRPPFPYYKSSGGLPSLGYADLIQALELNAMVSMELEFEAPEEKIFGRRWRGRINNLKIDYRAPFENHQ